MKKILLITAGNISLFLGIAGIFLPILPTTPFLLLSAACYAKSSKRLYDWLLNHKVLGLYIRSYLVYRAISVKTKVFSISLLWAVILSTVIFFTDILWLRILLVCIAAGVSIHLLSMNTLTKEMIKELENRKTKISDQNRVTPEE